MSLVDLELLARYADLGLLTLVILGKLICDAELLSFLVSVVLY